MQWLDGQHQAVISTEISHQFRKLFRSNLVVYDLEADKGVCVNIIGVYWKNWSNCISSNFGSICSRQPLFKERSIHLSSKSIEKGALVFGAFFPVFLAVVHLSLPQFANFSVLFQNANPLDAHESAKEHLLCSMLWALHVGFHRKVQPSELSVFRHLGRRWLQWSAAVIVVDEP